MLFVLLSILTLISGYYVFDVMSENEIDPFWNKLDTILICNDIKHSYDTAQVNSSMQKYNQYKIYSIIEKKDSLIKYYRDFHRNTISIKPIIS